jgi:hypothetical protein
MPILADIFSGDAFSAVSLTQAVNLVPNNYGRLQQLNLFPSEPIPTTFVAVQFANGVLNLLPTRERGGPPSLGMPERRNVRVFKTFHIPHDDQVLAEDVQNMLNRSGNGLDTVQDAVNRKLLRMRGKHGITLEHLRAGALRGVVLDSDGATLLNLFTTFGVTEKVVFFDFSNAAADIPGKVAEVVRHIEDNLLGDTMTGVRALCSRTFFDALTSHAKVVTAYQYFAAQQNLLREDVRGGFVYKGVTFEDYGGAVANAMNEDGTTTVRRFIPEGDARFFPMGTNDTFQTYFAPPDVITEINSAPSDEVYADQAIDPEFERWVKLHTQSNPLPVVKRPAVLVRGNIAAS